MIKKLVAFGCSWTYGDELTGPDIELGDSIQGQRRDSLLQQYRLDHCFAGLIAKHYGLECVNYGFPGASEESIRYALNWYCDNHNLSETIILVAHTDPARKSWFNTQIDDPAWNRFMHSPWLKTKNPDIDEFWYQLQKLWLGMSYHKQWADNNFVETTRLFDWVRLNYNVPVVQVKALKNPSSPGVNRFVTPEISLQELLIEQQQPLFAGGHPKETGHQAITNHLISYIDSVKLI